MATTQRTAVELRGVIKHAYPLQSLGDETRTLSAAFSLGRGPCGHSGVHRVVAWEFRVHLRGNGLVAIDHWDIGHDTEDVQRCFVVAEPHVLRNTHERTPRLLPRANGTTLEIEYEEPQSLPGSDQVKYLSPQVLRTRDLLHAQRDGGTSAAVALAPGLPRPNARGKRQLAEYQAPTGGHATRGSPYIYTKLGELIPGNANLYGVVVNMSLPKRSDGSDYYMSVQIIDETTPRREDATQVMVFYPSLDRMPKILYVGDVVRFHKIKINRYQDRIQGICSSRATRYLVLRRRDDGTIEQQTDNSSWTFDVSDEERFRQLSEWSRQILCSDVTLPPGFAAEQSEGANAKQWYELHFREVSSVMLVPDFVPDVQLRDPRPGKQRASRIAHQTAQERRTHEANTASASAIRLVTALVPRHIVDKVPITPIQVVLTASQVPRKYRCHARVTRLWPSDVSKLCKRVATNDSAQFVYSFVLRLTDTTGELDVIVHGSDAETFLQGIPPSDLSQPTASRTRVEQLLASLLSPQQAPIDCCLKSYRPATQSSAATVRYRLFDTRLEYQEV
ncbi:hypothetical protein PINS_up000303 [Pythium insidiosum]|nr:hypothetical protein PINS_up000303 [Pythium insidiosum]